ncbi:MAG TPA: hypothetical protein VK177_06240 [Flavobacteriales bacterium]|nr:hypothetical protein [Flavobacteriales bacterium]
MKTTKLVFMLLMAVCLQLNVVAQDTWDLATLPKTDEDFKKSEQKFLTLLKWIEDTPMDKETDKRTQVYAYLTAWEINSPTVTISVNSTFIDFHKKNSALLIYFMGGWSRYCLENNYSKDLVKSNLAGLRCALGVYNKGIGFKQDKFMDKIKKMEDAGELEAWVTEEVSKQKK